MNATVTRVPKEKREKTAEKERDYEGRLISNVLHKILSSSAYPFISTEFTLCILYIAV